MPDPKATFSPDAANVAAKVIDGELIIIRLSDGTYYSTDNVGTCVWQLLEAGHDVDAIVHTVAQWYEVGRDQVERDVATLIRELLDERLITEAGTGSGSRAAVAAVPDQVPGYEPPSLSIYRDMGNLLALDPPTPGIDDLLFRDAPAR